jgi:hypothetical protein
VSTGTELIRLERLRQQQAKGYTPERDARYTSEELSEAAGCYLWAAHAVERPHLYEVQLPPPAWPWPPAAWTPEPDRVGNLVKAGALIAAELDRLHVREGE